MTKNGTGVGKAMTLYQLLQHKIVSPLSGAVPGFLAVCVGGGRKVHCG